MTTGRRFPGFVAFSDVRAVSVFGPLLPATAGDTRLCNGCFAGGVGSADSGTGSFVTVRGRD